MSKTDMGYVSADWFSTYEVVEDFDGAHLVYSVLDKTTFPYKVIRTFKTLNEALAYTKEL